MRSASIPWAISARRARGRQVLRISWSRPMFHFFFRAEDGIRVRTVTGVQTCALPISRKDRPMPPVAKAVVLATGGVGRAFKVTSNSWEYTADGQALAYKAGAALQDMDFVQFHPTGMVWPPSVKGILVTEGVRGEGGVLRNKEGKRFMF